MHRASSLLGPVPLIVSFEWRTPQGSSTSRGLSFLSPPFSPLSSSPPHFYSKYRGSATREEEEEEVSRPIVMHDYSLRYRGAPRGYIRDLQFLCQIPARASFSRVRRRVVELWEAAVAAAAPCHCLKFSYPGWIRPMFYSAARTDAVLILHFREQGYKLIGTRFTIFSPSSLSFRFNSAKSSLKRRGSSLVRCRRSFEPLNWNGRAVPMTEVRRKKMFAMGTVRVFFLRVYNSILRIF